MVIIVIGIITAIGASMGRGKVDEAKEIQTSVKLEKIHEAMAAFRERNERLPCPAPQAIIEGDVNYGAEAANSGRCTGGTPAIDAAYIDAAGAVAEGAVPFKTLGLTEEYMIDGWGRRFTYAVARRYTQQEAFEVLEMYERCGGITVRDGTDTDRTTTAAYAVLSHGQEGHGAFTKAGLRFSADSTSAFQQQNCNCNAAGVFDGSYEPVYYQAMGLVSGTGGFDDIVQFKERWQMQNEEDRKIAPHIGPEVMLGITESPFVTFYSKSCETFSLLSAPASVPSAAPAMVAVSPDNNYWVAGGAFTPMLYIYKRNNITGALTKLADPAGLPSGVTANGVSFSFRNDFTANRNYMAVAHDVDGSSNALSVFKVDLTTDGFTLLSGASGPSAQPPSDAHGVLFHPSGKLLLASHETAPYFSLYLRDADAFNLLDAPGFAAAMPDPPAATPVDMAFSEDGRFLALALSAPPYLQLYTVNVTGPAFTLLASPGTLPAASATAVTFDRKTRYLMAGSNNGTDSITLYRIDNASNGFTAIASAGTSNAGMLALRFSPRQHWMAVGENLADGARVRSFIPVDEYFPLPATLELPSQPVSSRVSAMALRNRLLIY